MPKQSYTDAEFEVVYDPRRLPARPRAEPGERQGMRLVHWFLLSPLLIFAAITALVGLVGGDIDTRKGPPEPSVAVIQTSEGPLPIQTVKPVAGNVTDEILGQ